MQIAKIKMYSQDEINNMTFEELSLARKELKAPANLDKVLSKPWKEKAPEVFDGIADEIKSVRCDGFGVERRVSIKLDMTDPSFKYKMPEDLKNAVERFTEHQAKVMQMKEQLDKESKLLKAEQDALVTDLRAENKNRASNRKFQIGSEVTYSLVN